MTEQAAAETIHTYRPSVRPLIISLVLTLLVAGILFVLITSSGLDSPTESTLSWVLGLVTVVLSLRLLTKMFVLTRTKYVVTTTQLRREFKLFYRMRTRELPLSQLRGVELSRSTTQALFGFGDLRFLTAGTNQSLGFLTFEQIPNPVQQRDEIREQLEFGR